MPRIKKSRTIKTEYYAIKMKVVRALPGGEFESGTEFNCASIRGACATADRLQAEFDADGDPCRTYVFKGEDPVPIYAGLAQYTDGRGDIR